MHLIKPVPRVGPAGGQHGIARSGQPIEAGIGVDLKGAFDPKQMRNWSLGPTIGTVEIGCG
jgi:hypothetical protein